MGRKIIRAADLFAGAGGASTGLARACEIACLAPSCQGIAIYRGLCSRHYVQLSGRVRRGLTTWEAAEKAGHCKACIRGKDGLLRTKKVER